MDNWFKHFMKKSISIISVFLLIILCLCTFYYLRKKTVTINYLGHKYKITTLSNTVRNVIKDKKIYIDDTYSVYPNLDSIVANNDKIEITKNEELAKLDLNKSEEDLEYMRIEEETVVLDYEVEEKENKQMLKGNKKVVQKGVNGEKVTVYRTFYKGANRVNREVLYEHSREPVKEKIEIGSKESITVSRGDAVNVSGSDVDVLASLIQAEAGGEPYLGKVAVGAVCVNRLKTGRYGSDIKNVIYAPNQFCTVRLGMLKQVSQASQSYKAAQEALGGADPSNGALYFYNPKTASSSWSKSRPVTAVIGNHTFTK